MAKTTVHGGPSEMGNPDPGTNPDVERALAEGREPDAPKSAYITESDPTEDEYNDAMSRHGTDDFSDADKRVMHRWQNMRENQAKEKDEEDSESNDDSEEENVTEHNMVVGGEDPAWDGTNSSESSSKRGPRKR